MINKIKISNRRCDSASGSSPDGELPGTEAKDFKNRILNQSFILNFIL